jgi:hypothetical protein
MDTSGAQFIPSALRWHRHNIIVQLPNLKQLDQANLPHIEEHQMRNYLNQPEK